MIVLKTKGSTYFLNSMGNQTFITRNGIEEFLVEHLETIQLGAPLRAKVRKLNPFNLQPSEEIYTIITSAIEAVS